MTEKGEYEDFLKQFISYGIIIKLDAVDLPAFKAAVAATGVQVIYQRPSMESLWIVPKGEYDAFKATVGKV